MEDGEFPATSEDEESASDFESDESDFHADEWELDLNDSLADTVSVADTVKTDAVVVMKIPNEVDDAAVGNNLPPELGHLKGNIAFQEYVKNLVAKEVQSEKGVRPKTKGQRKDLKGKCLQPKGKGLDSTPGAVNINTQRNMIKSPSDTTLYTPAMRQIPEGMPVINSVINGNRLSSPKNQIQHPKSGVEDGLANQITTFIEGIRIQGENGETSLNDRDGGRYEDRAAPRQNDNNRRRCETELDELLQEAKEKSHNMILDAERFRASVNPPSGSVIGPAGRMMAENLDIDDQFFHVTCHVEEGLKAKIEKGEFVDLEKLLPKTRGTKSVNDNKLDLVYRDGQSFFVPSQVGEGQITGIRKWEQAFRIYAAVYSQANPMRSAEIWQYVHIINTAASSYVWDNVANYDFTFRHLMSGNPQRSWAKIYNRMWSISMKEPLLRGQNQGNSYNSMKNGGAASSFQSHNNANNSSQGLQSSRK